MELNSKAFGLAGAVLWGLAMFLMTWAYLWFDGYGEAFMNSMVSIYPGFEMSPVGSVIGLAWGFLDGFIALFLLSWLYNRFRS